MCIFRKKQIKQTEEEFSYLPSFKLQKNFNLSYLTHYIDKEIFPRVQEDEQYMLNQGGDPNNFDSTFDFVIVLCLYPELSLQYLTNTRPDIITFTVMMLDDLLYSKRFTNRVIIDLLNEYISKNAKEFAPGDYRYVIDIMKDYELIDNDSIFEKCYLESYVDLEKCIKYVLSEE